jgi:F-type H+-transporting ATPase subunit alpha
VFYLHSRLLERSVKLREEYAVVPKDLAADSTDRKQAKMHPQGLAAPADVRPDDEVGLFHRPHGKHRAEAFLASLADKDKYKVHKFRDSGGSMTALPIIETQEGEVSAYIPTNVISITDGQIFLEPDLFFAGVRPAVNVGISVSRVGGNAQRKAMKKYAGSLRLDLASFRALEAFAQLGTDLDTATQRQLDRGRRMVELLKQPQYQPYELADQVVSIFAGTQGFLDDLPVAQVLPFEAALLKHMRNEHPDILDGLRKTGDLPGDKVDNLKTVISNYKAVFVRGMKTA